MDRPPGPGRPPDEDASRASGPDPEAFDALYRADWRAVVALGWTLTGSRPVGEELAQDAFLDAYRRWSHVGALEAPGAWVRRAVANRAVSHRRHLRVVEAGSDRLATEARVRQDGSADAATPTEAVDPEFWAAVRALPERQAQCLALHYLEDRSAAEIAVVLDCRPATVRVHLHRGRLALARALGLARGVADLDPVAGSASGAEPGGQPTQEARHGPGAQPRDAAASRATEERRSSAPPASDPTEVPTTQPEKEA